MKWVFQGTDNIAGLVTARDYYGPQDMMAVLNLLNGSPEASSGSSGPALTGSSHTGVSQVVRPKVVWHAASGTLPINCSSQPVDALPGPVGLCGVRSEETPIAARSLATGATSACGHVDAARGALHADSAAGASSRT